ncbi:hypothetical protein nbrc107696_05780 [Gordonia spumicola]|uniref:Uncharacterized protein n=1 Tax=Gordonia spumicola TaxID=589161 RepID=A0A7I9V4M4_9ACTN|nr:hypothetical protein [Gordonia spumicola]GEE00132.1 hypothetical protein nbrc107696_05780 [Gordonia spumicola]
MPELFQSVRGKIPSTRALLAIGGAAAVAVGALSTTDTLAANNDAVSANTSQIASQNFFPVRAPVNPSYSTPGTCFGGNATLKWQAASGTPADQLWQIEEWGNSGTLLMWTSPNLVASTRERQTGMENNGGSTHEYRVYGVNATTNERSTGYVSIYFYRDGGRCNYSKGTATEGPVNITTWQETTDYTPFDSEEVINVQRSNRAAFEPPADASTSPSSTAPTTSSKPSSTEAPSSTSSTPSAPSSEAPTSTEESKAPTTSSAEADKITYGVGIAGTTKKLIIYKNGTEICDFDMAEGDTPSSNGNTVSVTNGSTVKTVNPKTCTLS